MKTLVLFITASLATAPVLGNAASVNDCPQIINNLTASASAITQSAKSYWKHRANFVNLKFGQASKAVPNLLASEQEENYGNGLRKVMPQTQTSFNDQITTALSQNCLSPSQMKAIVEPTIKYAKRVRFDKFPNDEERPSESSVNQVPSRMPNNN